MKNEFLSFASVLRTITVMGIKDLNFGKNIILLLILIQIIFHICANVPQQVNMYKSNGIVTKVYKYCLALIAKELLFTMV